MHLWRSKYKEDAAHIRSMFTKSFINFPDCRFLLKIVKNVVDIRKIRKLKKIRKWNENGTILNF